MIMMKSMFKLFGDNQEKTQSSADIAKDRLKVIVATNHRLNMRLSAERVEEMKQEIFEVVNKYIQGVQKDDVDIQQRQEDNMDILEMNVNLPERRD